MSVAFDIDNRPKVKRGLPFKIDGLSVLFGDGTEVCLTRAESCFFDAFVQCYPRTASRDYLLLYVYGDEEPDSAHNLVSVHIYNIRKKLAGTPVSIQNLWGVGYRLRVA